MTRIFLAWTTFFCGAAAASLATPRDSVYIQADSILQTMTPRQRAAQAVLVYHSPPSFLLQHEFGAVLVMQGMLRDTAKLKDELRTVQRKAKIPLWVSIDQEGGAVNRLGVLPRWKGTPGAQHQRRLTLDSLERKAAAMGRELHGLGINLNLAPVLDPSHDHLGEPSFMLIKGRSYGTGIDSIAPWARAFVRGFAREGIACVSKHFPGYDVQSNSDHQIAVSDADSQSVENYIAVFGALADSVPSIMMSSIHYHTFASGPAVLDNELVGRARALAPHAVLMTDDLWGTALRAWISKSEKVHPVRYPDEDFTRLITAAFTAGNDMFMITFPQKGVLIIDILESLTRENPNLARQLDDSVRRILAAKIRMGLI